MQSWRSFQLDSLQIEYCHVFTSFRW